MTSCQTIYFQAQKSVNCSNLVSASDRSGDSGTARCMSSFAKLAGIWILTVVLSVGVCVWHCLSCNLPYRV